MKVTVWHTALAALRPCHDRLLSEADRRRRAALRRRDDRDRLTLGVALARLAVARELAVGVGEVELDRTCRHCDGAHGKPAVASGRAHLSVAHSADAVAVAVCPLVPVGLDVEARAAADPGLAALVSPDGPPMDPHHALQIWCRKESAVKATGDGLLVPIQQVRVSEADHPPRLLTYPGRRLEASMHDLRLRPGYAAALTVLTAEPVTVLVREATAVLAL